MCTHAETQMAKIYDKFSSEYYSNKYQSLHKALEQIALEENSPHSMSRFVIFYSKPIMNPRIMIIGNNPSFFHHDLNKISDSGSGLTLAEENYNDVAERIPTVNSYIAHEHNFGIQLKKIFDDILQPHWLINSVGLNSFFLQTGGKGLARLRTLSDENEFRQLEAICTNLTKQIISTLKPKLLLLVGSTVQKKFSAKEFPRVFINHGTSCLDMAHPANRTGGWTVSSNDLKTWFSKNEGAYDHIN